MPNSIKNLSLLYMVGSATGILDPRTRCLVQYKLVYNLPMLFAMPLDHLLGGGGL